jgi:hypothetical protein
MQDESNHPDPFGTEGAVEESAAMHERAIPAAQVKTDPIRCPGCDKRNITLTGNITREFSERLENGEMVEQKLAEELARETSAIECRDCQVRFLIMTAEESDLLGENDKLYEELITSSPNFMKPANKLDC